MSAQNHAYTNKSRHTYIRDVCKLSNPEYIHNNWALLCSSCIKSSATKSVYQWLAHHMHHTISQIHKGMKTQCFHGFRSYQKHEIYFKKVITSLKKLLAALITFFLFKDWILETQLRIEFLTPNTSVWNQLHKTLSTIHWHNALPHFSIIKSGGGSLFCRGVEPPTKFSKRGGAWQDLNF